MNKSLILLTIKLVTIILVVMIFYIVVQNNISEIVQDNFINYSNNFKYKPSNTRIMYENTGTLPWERHTISSSIPFDVKVKDEVNRAYYYEFDNKSYDAKLRDVFKSNCEELIIATEGSSWSKWINPKMVKNNDIIGKLVEYYNGIYTFVYKRLNESPEMKLSGDHDPKNIQIVHDILLKYRYNMNDESYYMFDMEMVLYREGKLQGKHVKLFVITNGKQINVIFIKVIGVVSEDNIVLHPYTGVDYMNNVHFDVFIPAQNSSVDVETKNSSENTYVMKDDYLNSEIETVLYKKLLRAENVEDVDISNNNYIPKKEELVKRKECTL